MRFRNLAGRGDWLKGVALTGSGLLLAGVPMLLKARKERQEAHAEISAVQGLLRDHGVLNRVLLVYEECLRRLQSGADFNPDILIKSTTLLRSFIEDYHEDMEERYVFPVLERSGRFTELIHTLKTQHQAGKRMTAAILHLAARKVIVEKDQLELEAEIIRFVKMYRPHETREDTSLFPAFRRLADPKEYEDIGKKFQQRAHQLFGPEGFDEIVEKIAELEKALGIYDLKQFS